MVGPGFLTLAHSPGQRIFGARSNHTQVVRAERASDRLRSALPCQLSFLNSSDWYHDGKVI